MSQSRLWVYYVLSILALALGVLGIQRQFRLSALPEGFPAEHMQFPASFRGVPVASEKEIAFLAELIPSGTSIQVHSASGVLYESTLQAAHPPAFLIATLISGLLFLGVAAFIFAPRVRDAAVRDFFWCFLLISLVVLIGGVYFPRDPPLFDGVLNILQITSIALLPLLFLHLTLAFPKRNPVLDRFSWLMPTLWFLAGVAIVWQSYVFIRYFQHPHPENAGALSLPRIVADGLLVGQVVAACAILYWNTQRLELTRERKQTKWLLWGIIVGVTPSVFLRRLPQLVGLAPIIGPHLDPVFELAIPFAFVFAVVRYQFLDIDIIIRRTIIYASMAAVLVVVYLTLGVVLGRELERSWPRWFWALLIALGLVAGVMFNPLRRAIGRWVDRAFFKIQHNYSQWLQTLEQRLQTVTGEEQLAQTLSRILSDTLEPRHHAVVLRHREKTHVVGDMPRDEAILWLDIYGSGLPSLSGTLAAPHITSLPEIESPEFPTGVGTARIVMLQVIQKDADCLGVILLGHKSTGRRYVEPDIQFLQGVADVAGASLERLGLVQAVAEETMARRQLDELNRMKDEFLSRVAHDLRTPLASITWSSDNLLDRVLGDLNESQVEYLQSIKTSAGHLNRLVSNLLEITRLEQGAKKLELTPVDMAAVLEEAIKSMTPLAREKGVEIRLEVNEGCASVRGHSGKLVEVVINLLDNAVRYAPENSTVGVTLESAGGGRQVFRVRDHGPGLGEIDGNTLFDRFKQGDPSPHSGKHGFGLGLYIVKSYVEIMGGDVSAEDHPGGGALFSCYLSEFTGTHEVTQ
jgi:signal transduction histidine kinase